MNESTILALFGRSRFLLRIVGWTLILVAASFFIFLLSLRYWLLPHAEQYRENIASAISLASGQYVTLGEISANWDGLRPHMMLGTVRVHDKEGDVTLLLHRLEGTLSWRSIFLGELMFREISIDQPDLTVRRDSNGVIHVAGFALKKELTDSEHGFSDWLLNQRRVTIKNANVIWQDDQRAAPQLELLVNLRLENRGNRHRFGIRAAPPAELATELDMRGDLTGETLENPGLWQGQLFMQINNANVAGLRPWLPFPEEIRLNHGFGALRMWAGIDGANMSAMTADIHLYNVETQLGPNLPELNLARLRGRIGWQKIIEGRENGTRLFAHRLSAALRGKRELPPIDFSFQTINAHNDLLTSNKLSIDNLKLEILWDLAKYLPIAAPLQGKIKEVSPRGELHAMQMKWNGNWSTPSSFSAKGRFSNLGMKRSGRVPGFSGVTGNMDITQDTGTVHLNCKNTVINLPDIFNESLTLNRLVGNTSWALADDGSITLKFSNISFSNAHASGSAHGSFRTKSDGPGAIDLVAHLSRANANYLLQHIPIVTTRFSPDQIRKSVINGVVSDARIRLKGDLAQFPFANPGEGIFRLDTKVSGITVDKLPGWPRIENLKGNLHFTGRRLEFDANQANILGARLSRAKLRISDLSAPGAMLKSELEASGPTRQFVVFATSRTQDTVDDRLVDDIGIAGDGRLRLELSIPLNDPGAVKFSGNYQFIDNLFDPGSHMPSLHQVNGILTFTDSGISTKRISGHLLGGPVIIQSAEGVDGNTRLSVAGKVHLDKLREPWQGTAIRGAQAWTRYVSGSTDWQAAITIRNRLIDISVESSLLGITSDLPEPFSKTATDIGPLRLERKATEAYRDMLSVSYGRLLSAKIKRVRDDDGAYHAEVGAVNFGGLPGSLPDSGGIAVYGTLPHLDLDRWRLLSKQLGNEPTQTLNVTGINFHVDALDFLGKRFNDVRLDADKKEGLWYSTVISNEINGGITWNPSGSGKVVARLNRLSIPGNSLTEQTTVAQTQQKKHLPALDIAADNFIFDDKQLGKLELIASQEEKNWHIEKLHITNPDSSIMVRGLWTGDLAIPRVQAAVTLESRDIGKFLTRLGHSDRITRGSGKLEGAVSWQGTPDAIDYSTLSGTFQLHARRGQFPKFEPGIGRLFGIFNLRSLPRRITLDFRDVFSEGFGFDDISGNVKIDNGMASTNGLRIDGPSARVVINGQMSLEAETQKLHVRVTPSYGLASPVVGMASVIASTALKNPTTAKEYDITGTWADPVVTRISFQSQETAKFPR